MSARSVWFTLTGLLVAAGNTALAADESYATVANLIERVGRLEQRISSSALTEMMGQSEGLRSEVQSLRGDVEQLTHEIEELKQQQSEQYQDLEQRIKALSGSAAAAAIPGKQTGGDTTAASPPVTAPPPSNQPPHALVNKDDTEAAGQAYQKAFNSLKEGRFKESITLFKGFLASHPTGENVDNAYYWLGESYYVTRDFNAARETFHKLMDAYPKSTKAADALLRLGYIEYDTQKWAAANQILSDVSKRYPNTSAAQQAQTRLQQMKKEGH